MKGLDQPLRILFAAGGTGGHILPALQVAKRLESLAELDPKQVKIEFVGVGRAVETTILDQEKYQRHVLPGLGLKGKGIRGLRDFFKIAPAARQATKVLIDTFRPDVVVGFGGYPSVLPIMVAHFCKIPTWIHEADSRAGWATKFLSLFATKISSGYEYLALPFCRKVIFSGHPVRVGIVPAEPPQAGYIPKTILVLGGSQGSKSLDLAMPEVLKNLEINSLQIRHQARPDGLEHVRLAYQSFESKTEVISYISDMCAALNEADLIVSRAGAGALTELSILNKPVIFVPLPNVSGHQLENAKSLQKVGKALIVEEGDNFEIRLEDAIRHLLDPKNYKEMISRSFLERKTEAAQIIAEGIVALANR